MNSTGSRQKTSGKRILTVHLHRLLLGPLASLDAHLAGLHTKHIADGDAVRDRPG